MASGLRRRCRGRTRPVEDGRTARRIRPRGGGTRNGGGRTHCVCAGGGDSRGERLDELLAEAWEVVGNGVELRSRSVAGRGLGQQAQAAAGLRRQQQLVAGHAAVSLRHLQPGLAPQGGGADAQAGVPSAPDRKSTRLNSSHLVMSYAVFCLKKKKY